MSQITETNAQYYQGAQGFREDGVFNGEYPTFYVNRFGAFQKFL